VLSCRPRFSRPILLSMEISNQELKTLLKQKLAEFEATYQLKNKQILMTRRAEYNIAKAKKDLENFERENDHAIHLLNIIEDELIDCQEQINQIFEEIESREREGIVLYTQQELESAGQIVLDLEIEYQEG
jgi:tRNA U34 5-carboxymethylaminomethyl modifying GTPase MnmE/TrmE